MCVYYVNFQVKERALSQGNSEHLRKHNECDMRCFVPEHCHTDDNLSYLV